MAVTDQAVINQYEAVILYHPDLEADLETARTKVEKIFTDNGATVKEADNWGRRKLAYAIERQEAAVYLVYQLEVPAANVGKIESTLNITDEVIRFLITKPDLKKQAKAAAEKADKLKKAEARRSSDAEE